MALGLTGDELRDVGLQQAGYLESPSWIERADNAIEWLAKTRGSFVADDVRDLAGDPNIPASMGARLMAAARTGRITPVGFVKSDRPSRHSGYVRAWAAVREGER